MRIYCVNNLAESGDRLFLTIGEWYDAVDFGSCYSICNDEGRVGFYSYYHFKTEREIRIEKIYSIRQTY